MDRDIGGIISQRSCAIFGRSTSSPWCCCYNTRPAYHHHHHSRAYHHDQLFGSFVMPYYLNSAQCIVELKCSIPILIKWTKPPTCLLLLHPINVLLLIMDHKLNRNWHEPFYVLYTYKYVYLSVKDRMLVAWATDDATALEALSQILFSGGRWDLSVYKYMDFVAHSS